MEDGWENKWLFNIGTASVSNFMEFVGLYEFGFVFGNVVFLYVYMCFDVDVMIIV